MAPNNQRSVIFRRLKSLLQAYEPPFVAKHTSKSRYELWSAKEAMFAGRKRKEVFFASLVIQRSYVGFYYMPIYIEKSLKKVFKKELLATLKGMSCFHLTELNSLLLKQISDSLRLGLKFYRKQGWV